MSELQMPWIIRESAVLCGECKQYLFLVVKNNFQYQYYCLNEKCKDSDVPITSLNKGNKK